ncbi:MAG: acyltransferase [Candidatus Omnitrophica bacterium]|nr:acyltransferase [Candidatus Omnitrophota bacterium]
MDDKINNSKEIVTRDRHKDKSSSFNRRPIDLFRGFLYLKRKSQIKAGSNIAVRRGFELRMCDNAQMQIGDNCLINENTFIHLTKPKPELSMGDWVTLGRYTTIAVKGRVSIGSYTQIAAFCYILDHNHAFDRGSLILNQKAGIGHVSIGQDCWIGAHVMILPNVTIGDGAVIGAGSIVTKDIPPYTIAAGNPARIIKDR